MKQKNEVVAVFKQFKLLVENEAGTLIKAVRTDNGTEYTANEFKTICSLAEIQQQFTARYTPQQNGVCERRN